MLFVVLLAPKTRSKHSTLEGVYFAYMGIKNPEQIEPTRDVIPCFKFGDDRLRGLGSAVGQISAFPIDFDGRRPYNTLTVPHMSV